MAENADGKDRLADINSRIGDRIVIDPASVAAGAGTGAGESGDTGNSDNYARDANGTVQRNKDGSPRKKRGRKAGSGSNNQKKSKADISGLEKILFSAHLMAATAFKTPELILDEKEASMLAAAAQSVQDFYEVEASAEIMLWVNVIGVCGAIYGPRLIAAFARKKKETKNKPENKAPVTEKTGTVIEGVFTPHSAPTE